MTLGDNRTVYLVDDEQGVRDALSFLLRSRGLMVHSFANAPEVLAHLKLMQAKHAPVRGVFLVDVRMEPMSGLLLHEALLDAGIRNPLMFLSGHGDIPMVVEALKKGAFDFLEKPCSDNSLVDRVEKALSVEAAMHDEARRHTEVQARLDSLTDREREVMTRVAAGKLNKVIADELHIAVRTVEVHRARVFSKLSVRSAAELATVLAQN
jgi:two-component system, LuxR family, response regulator DctR